MQMASNQTQIDIIILNCINAKLQYTILFFWSPQGRYECDFCVFFIDYGQNKDLRHVDGPKSNINGNKSYWYDPQLLMYEIETRKVVVLVPPEDVTMRFLCSSRTFSGQFFQYLKKYDTQKKMLKMKIKDIHKCYKSVLNNFFVRCLQVVEKITSFFSNFGAKKGLIEPSCGKKL